LLHAIHSHLHKLILLTPYVFLGLEISTATAESSCRKTKTKVVTSGLRNLKIIPRNLNKIVLLRILSQYNKQARTEFFGLYKRAGTRVEITNEVEG
jgi:hypothetical protein